MRYLAYLREKSWKFVWLFIWLLTINVFLLTYRGSLWLSLYIDITAFISFFIVNYISYSQKKRYYQDMEQLIDQLDQKYLLPEMIDKGKTQEEQQIYQIIKEMGKSMSGQVNAFKYANREYKDYIEMWIHEVKIPIATAKLVLENHKNEVALSVDEELKKIEDYTEQALFYARSNYVEKDYMISQISLKEAVHQLLMRNKRNLIERNAQINIHDLDKTVLSDGKWLGFILNQILSNSIKYTGNSSLQLELYADENNGQINLHVKDNGIGVTLNDLPMVFEKGFTGTNGRKTMKSTGLGLYLCRKLCNRLGHKIQLISDGVNGSEVIISFSRTSFYDTI